MFRVIINQEHQYGILLDSSSIPWGWTDVGIADSATACASKIAGHVLIVKDSRNESSVLDDSYIAAKKPMAIRIPLLPRHHAFFEDWYAIDFNHYMLVKLIELNDVNAELLEQALYIVLKHHSVHLRFQKTSDGWEQYLSDFDTAISFFLLNLENIPLEYRNDVFEDIIMWAKCNLNLIDGPVIRAILFQMDKDTQIFLIVIHHFMADAFSNEIILKDIQDIYNQLLQNRKAILPKRTASVEEWAKALKSFTTQIPAQMEMQYWASLPWDETCKFPIAEPDPSNEDLLNVWYNGLLNKDITQKIIRLSNQNRVSIRAILLTALAQVFEKWTNEKVFLIEDIGHGRGTKIDELSVWRTVAWLVTHTPIILDIRDEYDLPGRMMKIENYLRLVPTGGVGYSGLRYLAENSQYKEQLRSLPRAQILFNYFGSSTDHAEKDSDANSIVKRFLSCSNSPMDVMPPYSMLIIAYLSSGHLNLGFSCSDKSVNLQNLILLFSEELEAIASLQ